MPRKKIPADLRSLARAHTELGIKVLAGIASAENAPPAARVAACIALLDRGWGRPEQAHTGADGGDIKVTIRRIIETDEGVREIESDVIDQDAHSINNRVVDKLKH